MIRSPIAVLTALFLVAWSLTAVRATDLPEIKERGVLLHLGIPYANFVTGTGDGLDVELMKRFAAHLDVEYQYVETNFKDVIADLTGQRIRVKGNDIEIVGQSEIKGDIVANGYTILPWRKKLVRFSRPTFPTGVWLVARSGFPMEPIRGTNDHEVDIAAVKSQLPGVRVLAMLNTCLDPSLYDLDATGAEVILYERSTNLNEMVPAILRDHAETTILDVPDALIALDKWPGQIKVIGPISDTQTMGVAVRKDSPLLLAAFNEFFEQLWTDGTYKEMVRKYYPSVFVYFKDFFED
jgi:ABC-type amino acid transport substrate-binding protein